MKKIVFFCLMLCILWNAAACQSRTGGGRDVPDPLPSAPAFSPIEPTAALIKDLTAAYLAGSFSSFVQTYPDFMYEAVPRYYYGFDDVRQKPELLLSKDDDFAKESFSAEDVLMNHTRLFDFYRHYDEGIPDSVCILGRGDPIPLWMTIYSFDGTALTRSRYMCGLNEDLVLDVKEASLHVPNEGFSQTDTEWVLTDESKLKIRFPKAGFAPREITEDTLQKTLLDGFDEAYRVSKTNRTVLLGGKVCQVYGILDQNGADTGYAYAVAQDYSRFYQVEQVDGQWILQARLLEP